MRARQCTLMRRAEVQARRLGVAQLVRCRRDRGTEAVFSNVLLLELVNHAAICRKRAPVPTSQEATIRMSTFMAGEKQLRQHVVHSRRSISTQFATPRLELQVGKPSSPSRCSEPICKAFISSPARVGSKTSTYTNCSLSVGPRCVCSQPPAMACRRLRPVQALSQISSCSSGSRLLRPRRPPRSRR